MSRPPRISIGLPVYNGEAYLAASIDSILAQTFEDFELILCDNASSDRTAAICAEYAARDARVRIIRHDENLGAAENYNVAFRNATGEFFRWSAHDDLIAPRHLEACLAGFAAGPESAVLCYPRTVIVDAEGAKLRDHDDGMDIPDAKPHQRLRCVVKTWSLCNPIFGLIRCEALARTGLIRKHVSSDVTLLCELALMGQFIEVPEPLFLRRMHQGTSRAGDRAVDDVARWFDPNAKGGSRLHPRTQLFFRVLSLAWNSELPLLERVRCVTTTTRAWWWRRFRVRAGRLRRELISPTN